VTNTVGSAIHIILFVGIHIIDEHWKLIKVIALVYGKCTIYDIADFNFKGISFNDLKSSLQMIGNFGPDAFISKKH
jgi:hypothetical protein